MNCQVTGDCRRAIEFIFDVDDTERLCVEYMENYEGEFQCQIHVGEYVQRRPDGDVPFGCAPDYSGAERVANDWLKFHRLTPAGIVELCARWKRDSSTGTNL